MVKNINRILDSEQYKIDLQDIASKIIKYSKENDNEASIAAFFEQHIYNYIRNTFELEIPFKKELTNKDINRGSIVMNVFSGRMDAMVNQLVLEYKKPSTLNNKEKFDKAKRQLVNYLEQLNQQGNQFEGILTDGIHYASVTYSNHRFRVSSLRILDISGLDFLIRSILNVNKKQLISANLVNDFGRESALTCLQKNLYLKLKSNNVDKVNMLFQEWMSIYHLSLNDDGKSNTLKARRNALSKALNEVLSNNEEEYKALFALETGYAIVVKLFALKILPKLNLSESVTYFGDLLTESLNSLQRNFENVENGYVFNTSNITNLLEEDFFSWYSIEEVWDSSIAGPIKDLLGIINDYSDTSLAYHFESTDLFKEIYMLTIPGDVRKAFGEYFTPDWLADNVVLSASQMIKKRDWTFLDPTCGSGTFLLRAINKVVEQERDAKNDEEILKDILHRVRGIDLNPLSVLSARVSYLLAIRPFIHGYHENIEIPVYLGDSAKLPHIFESNGTKYVEYQIATQRATIDAVLPLHFVESSRFLPTIYKWQTFIKSEQPEILRSFIIKEFNDCSDELILDQIDKLSRTLVTLHKEKWDGIWLRIISNFLLPTRIKDVDIIAGNPPWVKWENLPLEYAKEIKHIAGNIDLFSGKNYGLGGGINLNLAALISNVTADHWLNKDGVLAFLMPDTLLNSDSYEGWRNLRISNGTEMYLAKITDWSGADHPFKPVNDSFLTYFITKYKVEYPELTAIIKNFSKGMTISKVNNLKDWESASQYFSSNKGNLVQLSKASNRYSRLYDVSQNEINSLKLLYGKNHYKARQGVELTPREVYIFEKNIDDKYSNIISKGAKIKSLHKEHIHLESEMMRTLMQSYNVGHFSINRAKEFQYGLIPYDSEQNLYSQQEMALNYPQAYAYLLDQRKFIEQQSARSRAMARGNEFYALSKLGSYSTFDYAVVFRDNSNMMASFVDNTGPLKLFPVKHAPFFSRDISGQPISKEEALYLSAILNTPIVNKYFKVTYSGRSYSINFDINIPKYKDLPLQKELADLSLQIVAKKKKYSDLIDQIQNVYLKLLRSLNK